MKSCDQCQRPLLPVAEVCPFCGLSLSSRWKTLAMATLTPFVLSACYGPPPGECFDGDGDGYGSRPTACDEPLLGPDCDDADPAVNPDATEICDDQIDNDCDGLIDSADTEDCPQAVPAE